MKPPRKTNYIQDEDVKNQIPGTAKVFQE